MIPCSHHNTTSGIYALRCSESGRCYVGRSCAIGTRVMAHIYILRNGTHDNNALQADFVKYGESSFDYVVLKELRNYSKQAMLDEEKKYIDSFDFKTLYNARKSSNVGAYADEITEETRVKQSLRQMGDKNHFHGKKHSEETLEKMRAARAALPKFKCQYCSFEGLASTMALHVKKHNSIKE